MIELGGFAEDKKVIDGDFNAFNYCLSELYVYAFYQENFESIGEIDEVFFRDICYWYNYNKELDHEKTVKEIENGTFITKKNRTIIDAILELIVLTIDTESTTNNLLFIL